MLQLTDLSGKRIHVNFNLVKFIEEAPDTILVFLDGSRMPVKETIEFIKAQMREQQTWK